MQRTGTQEPLAWLKNGVTLRVWPCNKATTGVRPGVLSCYWSPNLSFLHPAVELLADIVQNCSLEDSQVEKERDVIDHIPLVKASHRPVQPQWEGK